MQRETIIQLAAEMFVGQGIKAVRMDDIARHIGVSKRTIYEQFGDKGITGSVVKGTIIRLTPDFAIVDVGLKSEGRIPLREFGQNAELKVGDKVEVYVDRYEDKDGQIVLSREKASSQEVWKALSLIHN